MFKLCAPKLSKYLFHEEEKVHQVAKELFCSLSTELPSL